jgi:hypothetical protein
MKKLSYKEQLEIRFDGKTIYEIGPKGCLVPDTHADNIKRRWPFVTVVEVDVRKETAKAESAPEPEAAPAEPKPEAESAPEPEAAPRRRSNSKPEKDK